VRGYREIPRPSIVETFLWVLGILIISAMIHGVVGCSGYRKRKRSHVAEAFGKLFSALFEEG
jgi:hypothetical protein